MVQDKNIIRLTESEFKQLIETSVAAVLEEGKFGDIAKKVGKGIGKAALATGMAYGALNAAEAGLQSQDEYDQELNRQSIEMQGPSERQIDQYLKDNHLQDTEANREDARKYFINMYNNRNESVSRRLSQIIREEISKVL